MEKTFRRYATKPSARHAFAEAEAAAYLAHQIRVLRTSRGWKQADLARQLGTTQAAVSRMEDESYGRMTFKTMYALAKVFDVAPLIKFVSTVELLRDRWVIDRASMAVPAFANQAHLVDFVDDRSHTPPPTRTTASTVPLARLEAQATSTGFVFEATEEVHRAVPNSPQQEARRAG